MLMFVNLLQYDTRHQTKVIYFPYPPKNLKQNKKVYTLQSRKPSSLDFYWNSQELHRSILRSRDIRLTVYR